MIKTINHKGLRELHQIGRTRHVDSQQVKRAKEILRVLDEARTTHDIDLPGYNLHTLAPTRPAVWTIRLRGPFRITFTFRDGDAYDVDLEQYH